MLGGLGDLAGLMRQAKQMKGRMDELQVELTTRRYAAESGAGAVTATVDGKGTLVDIRIKPEATADVELLEDLIKAAVGTAVKRAQQEMQAEMSKLTGGMNIPALGNMFGAG